MRSLRRQQLREATALSKPMEDDATERFRTLAWWTALEKHPH
jgi:hypothetical protein